MAQRSSLMGNDDFGVLTRLGSAAIARRLGRVLEFMRVLWAVDHALQSTSKWMEVRLGVTGPQRLVIRIVRIEEAAVLIGRAIEARQRPPRIGDVLRLDVVDILSRLPAPERPRAAELTEDREA